MTSRTPTDPQKPVPSAQMSGYKTLLLIAFLAIPTLFFVAQIIFNPDLLGLVLWPREYGVAAARLIPFGIAFLAYLALGHFMFQNTNESISRRRTLAFLTVITIAAVALQVAALSVPEMFPLRALLERTYSNFTGGWFTLGARVGNVGDFLSSYAERMYSYPLHSQRYPPGLPLIFWAGARLAALAPGVSSAIAPALRPLACFDEGASVLSDAQIVSGLIGAIVEVLAATLAIVPLFLLVKKLAGVRAGMLASIIYPMTACMLLWVGRFDHAFPLFSATGLLICEHMVSSRKTRIDYAIGLGVVLGLATLMSYGNAQTILVCAIYFIVRAIQLKGLSQWRNIIGQGLIIALSFVAFWAMLAIGFNLDVIGTFWNGMRMHLSADRPYWPWVVWGPWDLFTHIGLPISLIAVTLMWKRQPALALALVGAVVPLALSHFMRAEVGRTGALFAPLAVALAAIYLAPRAAIVRAAALGLVVIQVFTMVAMFRVSSFGIDPETLADAVVPADITATNVRYEENGEIQLLGYKISEAFHPGEYATLVLYWKLDSTRPLSASYSVFLHIADSLDDGIRIVNQDSKPMNWGLPTTCWRPNMVVRDQLNFRIDPNAVPGQYVALVGLYDEDNKRAFIQTADIAKGGAVQLPVTISINPK